MAKEKRARDFHLAWTPARGEIGHTDPDSVERTNTSQPTWKSILGWRSEINQRGERWGWRLGRLVSSGDPEQAPAETQTLTTVKPERKPGIERNRLDAFSNCRPPANVRLTVQY